MVAGIIVCAAADEKVLSDPGQAATAPAAWITLGGPALFLAGHAAFKFVVWRVVSWPRLAGITALALPARTVPALALAACTATVVIAVAATGRLPLIPHPEDPEGEESPGPAFS
ncbi:MAG TPA: low temperature requirement protein A [Streptosporangiaceae bacterium]|nr:low temperature requirement protein A [Streptosporangiaceae bacterium]